MAGSSEGSCLISYMNIGCSFSSFMRHFAEEEDDVRRRKVTVRKVFSHSGDIIFFYFLLPINTTFPTSSTSSIIFHLFFVVCHTPNISHISFFLFFAWPLTRPLSLSAGLGRPLTPLRLWCNVSGPGLLLLASAAGSAPNAIERLFHSLCFPPIFT